tara:strand:+ start:10982 stop:11188 length:207 start_codon:yes stop_codon:yes gene_type:complete
MNTWENTAKEYKKELENVINDAAEASYALQDYKDTDEHSKIGEASVILMNTLYSNEKVIQEIERDAPK